MNTTSTSTFGFAPASEWKIETLDRLFKRQTIQRIASAASLISQAIGFCVVGVLMIVNRHQSDLNGLSGGSSIAMIGGIGAVLLGAVFLVAACVYCKFFAGRSARFPAKRQAYGVTSSPVERDFTNSRSLRLSWHLLPG
jgi:hypothetical protein